MLARRARGLLVTLLACLCTNNTAGCAPCAQSSRDALTGYERDHPGDSAPQLLARAITEHRADVALGVLDHEGSALDINAVIEPDRHGSASPLMTALAACDATIVKLVAARPGFDLGKSLAPSARWEWVKTCPAEVTDAFLAIPGADPGAADGNGETMLHAAARAPAAIAALRTVLARPGIDADAKDASGMSPLHVAAVAGNDAAVEALLAHPDVDPNNQIASDQRTVLVSAVFAGHDAVAVRLLARSDVDVNAVDAFGNTALHLAADAGHVDALRALLARPEIEVNVKDQLGRTALSRAAARGHADAVAALLGHPAIVVNLVDRDRQTPLFVATAGGHVDVARQLLADARVDSSITSRPDRRSARDVAAGLGLSALLSDIDRQAAAHPGKDELDPADDYADRSYETPPAGYIRPEPRRPR
jgi:ankyrin repeat protein